MKNGLIEIDFTKECVDFFVYVVVQTSTWLHCTHFETMQYILYAQANTLQSLVHGKKQWPRSHYQPLPKHNDYGLSHGGGQGQNGPRDRPQTLMIKFLEFKILCKILV